MFITLEGSEGSGKSTQFTLLAQYLIEQELVIVTTREPGGTRIGEQVRECLHDVANTEMSAAAEALLYSASRAQLVEEVIRPALAAGTLVLSDRYSDSTLAYQGYGRGLNLEALRHLTELATGNLKPDRTFFLDVDVARGLSRRAEGGAEMNRMDLQGIDFYERVRQGYLALAAAEPRRWTIVDANRPLDVIQADLRRHVSRLLGPAPGSSRSG